MNFEKQKEDITVLVVTPSVVGKILENNIDAYEATHEICDEMEQDIPIDVRGRIIKNAKNTIEQIEEDDK